MSKKSNLSSLLYSKKFLLIISFLLAFIIWGLFSIYKSPETEKVIKDVPVTIDMSVPNQLGFAPFGAPKDLRVDVKVKAKRYLFGSKTLSAENFQAVAVTTNVNRPGSYVLNIKVTPPNSTSKIEIISKSKDSINVYFDVPSTKEYRIEPVLKNSDILKKKTGYFVDEPVLSNEKVNVTGPANEIAKIDSVKAIATATEEKNESFTLKTKFQIKDKNNKDINYLSYNIDVDNITMTVPIYKIMTLPTGVLFENVPTYYAKNSIDYEISPSTIHVGVLSSVADKTTVAELVKVDFSLLHGGLNKLTFDSNSVIKEFKILDKDQKIKVSVNMGNVKSNQLTLPINNIKFNNLKSGTKAKVINSEDLKINVLGPASELANLKSDDMSANIDLKEATPGEYNFPLNLIIKNDYCWEYGKYQLKVIVE